MKTLDLYIGKHILLATLIVMVVLVLLNGLFMLLAEVNSMREYYHLYEAIVYVMRCVPALIVQMIPVSALIGTIVGLSILSSSNELVIMRSGGFSTVRIFTVSFCALIPFILIAIIASETFIPRLQNYAVFERNVQRSASSLSQGLWWYDGHSYVYIGSVSTKKIEDVNIFSFDQSGQISKTIYAPYAKMHKGKWILHQAKITTYQSDKMINESIDTLSWPLKIKINLIRTLSSDPYNLSAYSLLKYIYHIKNQHIDAQPYWLTFFSKVLFPFNIMVLILIGIAFVFGPLRSVAIGHRLSTGIITGVVFILLQKTVKPIAIIFHIPALLATLFPIVLAFVLAILILQKKA